MHGRWSLRKYLTHDYGSWEKVRCAMNCTNEFAIISCSATSSVRAGSARSDAHVPRPLEVCFAVRPTAGNNWDIDSLDNASQKGQVIAQARPIAID
jgi:hypothetical protein